MTEVPVIRNEPDLPAVSTAAVRELEAAALRLPQVAIETQHEFWAGMYARTILIPAGICLTGAEIKIATLLIVSGDVFVGRRRLTGYHVLTGEAGRKNAFVALADTWLTMIFPTAVTTVDEAERQFTDEFEKLGSRRNV